MDCIMKFMKITYLIFSFLSLFLINSCSRLYYTGSYSMPDFSPVEQPNELGTVVKGWEDGVRTSGEKGEFEWWYFDAKMNDGSFFVCYFWKIHFGIDRYFIGMNYTPKEGKDIFHLKYFNKKDVSFSSDSCKVIMGDNYFIGNLNSYNIKLSSNDFEGFGIDINLDSELEPFRPQDGIIKAGDDYFAWLAAVPAGKFFAQILFDGEERIITGDGYHDHNWGNTPLQRLFDGWIWFRGKTSEHTIIAADLFTSDKRGGFDIPILYVANSDGVLINRFGENGLFTKYSNKINNLYNKKNEPFFSKVELLTDKGEFVAISGERVLDNADVFSRSGLPKMLSWVLKLSARGFSIDPHYTRFESNLNLKVKGSSNHGFGILEIMDLK